MKSIKNILTLPVVFSLNIFGCSCDDSSPAQNENNNDSDCAGYKLVWTDEFDGSEIDNNKWGHEVNANGGGNNELQYYTARPEKSFVQDGNLHIVRSKKNMPPKKEKIIILVPVQAEVLE